MGVSNVSSSTEVDLFCYSIVNNEVGGKRGCNPQAEGGIAGFSGCYPAVCAFRQDLCFYKFFKIELKITLKICFRKTAISWITSSNSAGL